MDLARNVFGVLKRSRNGDGYVVSESAVRLLDDAFQNPKGWFRDFYQFQVEQFWINIRRAEDVVDERLESLAETNGSDIEYGRIKKFCDQVRRVAAEDGTIPNREMLGSLSEPLKEITINATAILEPAKKLAFRQIFKSLAKRVGNGNAFEDSESFLSAVSAQLPSGKRKETPDKSWILR